MSDHWQAQYPIIIVYLKVVYIVSIERIECQGKNAHIKVKSDFWALSNVSSCIFLK